MGRATTCDKHGIYNIFTNKESESSSGPTSGSTMRSVLISPWTTGPRATSTRRESGPVEMGKDLNKYPPVEWSSIWGPLPRIRMASSIPSVRSGGLIRAAQLVRSEQPRRLCKLLAPRAEWSSLVDLLRLYRNDRDRDQNLRFGLLESSGRFLYPVEAVSRDGRCRVLAIVDDEGSRGCFL
jgi:hypothetical protein